MEEGVFEVKTEYARTQSGLILPHKEGTAVLVLGANVPDRMKDGYAEQLEATFDENQGAVLISPRTFTLAALDVALQRGWRPPQS